METVDLRQYLQPLFKWWWLLLACTLLAGVSGAVYSSRQPVRYASSTTLMVGAAILDPNPSSGDLYLSSQLAGAYADIANRSMIREATAASLEMEWLPPYTARVLPNSQLIEIVVTDESPERAQLVANELASQLIAATPGQRNGQGRQEFIENQIADLETGIVETQREIERIEGELTQMFSAREIADAKAQILALESKLSTLQANYAALLANSQEGALNTVSVLEAANLPAEPMNARLMLNVLVAALVGFSLAAVGAYGMEYFDDSLRDEEDSSRWLDLPTLGSIPKISGMGTNERGVILPGDRYSAVNSAYANLRLNLQVVGMSGPLKLLLISSASPGEGKSTVAANLSIELARTGRKVILVDADLHKPAQQRLFELDNRSGVTTSLLDPYTHLSNLIQPTRIDGLSVLTSGPLLPNPTSYLAREPMHDLLLNVKDLADIVVIDSPPLTAAADASILARYVDGLALVISAGQTKRTLAKHIVKGLRQLRAPLLGTILYGTPLRQSLYRTAYGYGYDLDDVLEQANNGAAFHPRKRTANTLGVLNVTTGDHAHEPKPEPLGDHPIDQ